MARDFTKNLANHLHFGVGGIGPLLAGAGKVSFHVWAQADSYTTTSGDNQLFTIWLSPTGFSANVEASGANRFVRVGGRSTPGDGFQVRSGTTDLAGHLGAWVSLGGVLDFAGDRITPYARGRADNPGAVTFGANAYTLGTPTSADCLGMNDSSTGTTPNSTGVQFDGRLAEFAVWRADVGPDGFRRLAAGEPADAVLPGRLAFYLRLAGGEGEADRRAGRVPTLAGSLPTAAHPPVRRRPVLPGWAALGFAPPAPGGEYYPARYFAARYFARPYFGSGEAVVGVSGPTDLMSIARTIPGEAIGSIARALPASPSIGSIPRTLADEPTSLGETTRL